MTHQLLDRAKIHAAPEKVRAVTVAQRMERCAFPDTRILGAAPDSTLERSDAHGPIRVITGRE